VDAQIVAKALARIDGRKDARQLAVADHEGGADMLRRHLQQDSVEAFVLNLALHSPLNTQFVQ
jgi:hypothetical protein